MQKDRGRRRRNGLLGHWVRIRVRGKSLGDPGPATDGSAHTSGLGVTQTAHVYALPPPTRPAATEALRAATAAASIGRPRVGPLRTHISQRLDESHLSFQTGVQRMPPGESAARGLRATTFLLHFSTQRSTIASMIHSQLVLGLSELGRDPQPVCVEPIGTTDSKPSLETCATT